MLSSLFFSFFFFLPPFLFSLSLLTHFLNPLQAQQEASNEFSEPWGGMWDSALPFFKTPQQIRCHFKSSLAPPPSYKGRLSISAAWLATAD